MHRYSVFVLLVLVIISGCNQVTPSGSSTTFPELEKNKLSFLFNAVKESRWPLVSAHRGGKSYPGYPENCLETFEFVLKQCPALIECDIALTRDSQLVLMHDNTVDRTTTGTGSVQQYTLAALQELVLLDPYGNPTNFKIPSLKDVLLWAKGKTILTLDIKRSVPYSLVVDLVQTMNAHDYALVITYSANAAAKVHQLAPQLMLSLNMSSLESIEKHSEFGIPASQSLAFVGVSEPTKALYQQLHQAGICTMLGTLGNLDQQAVVRGDLNIYPGFIDRGADILATDRPVEAYQALAQSFQTTMPDSLLQLFFSLSPSDPFQQNTN